MTILIAALLVLPVVVTAFFAFEVLTGLARWQPPSEPDSHASAVIVIPAHDEEAVIHRTVSETSGNAPEGFAVLVVADNCSDRTAEKARSAGASVVIRDDPEDRGKGYALAFARDHLRNCPPDVVVVLDADCRIEPDSLRELVAAAKNSGRPAQAINLLAPDLSASPLVQLSTFAFMIKNLIRQRGLQRLAGRVHLTGTGMALPWNLFVRANLGGSNIVEDLALGLEFADRATAPKLVARAAVWSAAASESGTLVQRNRWEGGYLATALRIVPKSLARSLFRGDARGLLAALDLSVPPLALLVLLDAGALLLAVLGMAAGAAAWPTIILIIAGVLAATAVALAWLGEGRRFASASALLRLPLYVLWKLPMYIALARRGAPKEWLRTGR